MAYIAFICTPHFADDCRAPLSPAWAEPRSSHGTCWGQSTRKTAQPPNPSQVTVGCQPWPLIHESLQVTPPGRSGQARARAILWPSPSPGPGPARAQARARASHGEPEQPVDFPNPNVKLS